jgi:hypothetical protein
MLFTWYFYRGVALGYGFPPLLLFCFGFIHLLIIYYTFFYFSFFYFVMQMFSWVSLPHLFGILLSRNVSLQSCTDYHTPLPPKHLHQPYWLALHYWEFITAHTLPFINNVLGQPAFVLDSWPLKKRWIGCPESLVRNYHHLLHNNLEEHSSYLLYKGRLKSCFLVVM